MTKKEKDLRGDLVKAEALLASLLEGAKVARQYVHVYISKKYFKETFLDKIEKAQARVERRQKALIDAGFEL